jgi:hypothetical protein
MDGLASGFAFGSKTKTIGSTTLARGYHQLQHLANLRLIAVLNLKAYFLLDRLLALFRLKPLLKALYVGIRCASLPYILSIYVESC